MYRRIAKMKSDLCRPIPEKSLKIGDEEREKVEKVG